MFLAFAAEIISHMRSAFPQLNACIDLAVENPERVLVIPPLAVRTEPIDFAGEKFKSAFL